MRNWIRSSTPLSGHIIAKRPSPTYELYLVTECRAPGSTLSAWLAAVESHRMQLFSKKAL